MKNIILTMIYESDEIKVPPFSLMYVGGALRKAGYDVKILHKTPDKINQCVEIIQKEKPLFSGFSVLSGPPAFYAALISKKLKETTDIPIVWGGIHPSLLPQQCLKEKYIDIIVIGEGEETSVELAKALEAKIPLERIAGIGYKDKTMRTIINPARQFIDNLDSFRMDFSLVDMQRYINERVEVSPDREKQTKRSLGYISSRGCPYACGFCYNLKFNQRRWRTYSESAVIEDIIFFKEKYNINEIHFWDDNFFVDRNRAFKILEKTGVAPGIEIRIDAINEAVASRLKEVNTDQLLIGAESGSNRILGLINKGFDTNETIKKVKILAQNHLDALYSFILGIPTETKEELFMTLDLILKIHELHQGSSFTVGLYLPYPGTPLYDLAIKEKFVPPSDTMEWKKIDRWENAFSLPWINNRIALNVRNLMAMLSWNIALLNRWIRFRIKHRILLFSYDIKLLIFTRYFFNQYLSRCLSKKH